MCPRERGRLDWTAASWAGLVAASVFVLFELILAGLVGAAAWTAPHLIMMTVKSGELVGRNDLGVEPLLLILAAAMGVHVAIATAYTMLIAWLTRGLDLAATVGAGLGFGLAIYLVNFYLVLPLLPARDDPGAAGGLVTLASHLVFGVFAAAGYCLLAAHRRRRRGLTPRPA